MELNRVELKSREIYEYNKMVESISPSVKSSNSSIAKDRKKEAKDNKNKQYSKDFDSYFHDEAVKYESEDGRTLVKTR